MLQPPVKPSRDGLKSAAYALPMLNQVEMRMRAMPILMAALMLVCGKSTLLTGPAVTAVSPPVIRLRTKSVRRMFGIMVVKRGNIGAPVKNATAVTRSRDRSPWHFSVCRLVLYECSMKVDILYCKVDEHDYRIQYNPRLSVCG